MNTHIEVLGLPRIKSPLQSKAEACKGISNFVQDESYVRLAVETGTANDLPDMAFEKAGARKDIFFDPAKTTAAIVTCGGLCPGLNNVIRSAFMEFYFNYGVQNVWGIRYGYAGLNPELDFKPIRLTPEIVERIHEKGGTILGSSRGEQPAKVVVDYLEEFKINILLCVGGDGTLRGANDIADEITRRKLPIAVIGVPKTIDNDVMYMTRTFGLATAAEVSRMVLSSAHVEATSAYNGIGLVKVMGRDAGFIAAVATLASQDVNFCLIPEVPLMLEGPKGFLEHLRKRLEERHHALVVVAEGAGQELMRDLPGGTDASGNKRYGDIGSYLKEQIVSYFKRINKTAEVKYIDPSYYIRSVPANVDDAILCDQFARNAVHAGMAGKTKMVVSFLNGSFANIPIALAVSKKKHMDTNGIYWTSVLASTGQPATWA